MAFTEQIPPLDAAWVTDRGQGPGVVAIHGQPGNRADFEPLARCFGGDYRLVTYDRPGYGANPEPVATMAENADYVAGLIASRFAQAPVVLGHSYGGGIALLLAQHHPELVGGLVLVASVGSPKAVAPLDPVLALPAIGPAMVGALLMGLRHRAPTRVELDAVSGRRRKRVANIPDRPYIATFEGTGHSLVKSVVIEQRHFLAARHDLDAALAAVSSRTEVIGGDLDTVVSAEAERDLATRMPNAQFTMVPGVGHFVIRDAPQMVRNAVDRLLR